MARFKIGVLYLFLAKTFMTDAAPQPLQPRRFPTIVSLDSNLYIYILFVVYHRHGIVSIGLSEVTRNKKKWAPHFLFESQPDRGGYAKAQCFIIVFNVFFSYVQKSHHSKVFLILTLGRSVGRFISFSSTFGLIFFFSEPVFWGGEVRSSAYSCNVGPQEIKVLQQYPHRSTRLTVSLLTSADSVSSDF